MIFIFSVKGTIDKGDGIDIIYMFLCAEKIGE